MALTICLLKRQKGKEGPYAMKVYLPYARSPFMRSGRSIRL
jgi:hypothetical protein